MMKSLLTGLALTLTVAATTARADDIVR